MEDALAQIGAAVFVSRCVVLILVLMEDALALFKNMSQVAQSITVLILVLMEDALAHDGYTGIKKSSGRS